MPRRAAPLLRVPPKPGGLGSSPWRAKPKASQRLSASRRVYAETRRRVWERDDGLCVACRGAGGQVHHRVPRGMGGASRSTETHTLPNVLLLCPTCHGWIETHRDAAYTAGWLVHRGQDPALVPVLRWGRWVLLDSGGGVEPCRAV